MPIHISICLPTLNSIDFLAERLASIRQQTFTDWELVAIDSHSEDGTFEMLSDFASIDARVRVYQAPRDGIYPNFNRGIRRAHGRFVYIATSDDTMAPDCLEKLHAALIENSKCDLAHCPMKVLDESGGPGRDWWTRSSLFARSSGDYLKTRHIRVAPLDGVLCLLGDNIYSSVTQLLIRRSLFDRIGYYHSDWGSLGDFHWNLRAGLATSTIHVPDTWGGWRMHPNQATAAVRLGSANHQGMIDAMIADVLLYQHCYLAPEHQGVVFKRLERRARELRNYLRRESGFDSGLDRRGFVIREALLARRPAWQHLASLIPGRKRWPAAAPATVRSWLNGVRPIPVPGNSVR